MPYIGKQPTIGEFVELDALTASATDTYTLTRNSAAYYPETVNNLLVSINGVIQAGSTMSLSGNTLTVGATLSSSDVIDFVRVFGNVGNVVTPTDGSVTSAKLDTNIAISGNLDVGSIRATNGTAAMTIDSSGRILTPQRVAFYATRTAGSISSGNVVPFDSVDFNVGNAYSSSTGIFTCPVAGIYLFQCNLISGSTANIEADLLLNNSRKFNSRNYSSSSGTQNGIGLGGLLQLSINDEVKIIIGGSSNTYGSGGGGFDTFSGCLIG
tara:strand:- start:568 stop:1371 length:804 start_codon:yes stop_codon:yes gene_type:complete